MSVRLDKICNKYRDQIDLQWKSYALLIGRTEAKSITPHSRTSRLAASRAEPEASFSPWDEAKLYISSSLPALEAAKCARIQGEAAFQGYHAALFRALFVQSRDISDPETLVHLAGEQGLDENKFRTDLESGAQKIVVMSENLELISEYGKTASGVPLVIIDGRDPIIGAGPSQLYGRVIERILEKRTASSPRQ